MVGCLSVSTIEIAAMHVLRVEASLRLLNHSLFFCCYRVATGEPHRSKIALRPSRLTLFSVCSCSLWVSTQLLLVIVAWWLAAGVGKQPRQSNSLRSSWVNLGKSNIAMCNPCLISKLMASYLVASTQFIVSHDSVAECAHQLPLKPPLTEKPSSSHQGAK
ncbi:hypothetical protein B0J13DRAFT_262597 [Dactylonectria estremocensis]|uniref:Uncharacterized protein n=1 Tax=Dactylonectria estremocensis TaxID=1079267 RepID=A0A9P9F3Z4_9HYPO|nr:hypothetical protein B0J13DRAFT_262597 [Dactylonectria estremocensis]